MGDTRRYELNPVTDASGDATVYTSEAIKGKLISINYVKPGSGGFADGVDFAFTGETTGQNYWTELNVNASEQVAPRQPTHDNAGVASLYAATGEPVEDHYYIPFERIKLVIAQGGDTLTGQFFIIVE